MELREHILDLSRQNQIGEWGPVNYFSDKLDQLIADGTFRPTHDLDLLLASIIRDVTAYRLESGVGTVVLGMSGGVDSALTAAIFKNAGYRVIGVTMPIHQDPSETERGVDACKALGIEHIHMDLSDLYDETLKQFSGTFSGKGYDEAIDPEIGLIQDADAKSVKVRRGNIRARLRMITLYNLAQLHGGFVASTDNFSELVAGFWTLHGDVGDVSPIQSLYKSWEVPYLAQKIGVPEHTVRAKPTDGLGIDAGDEAQLGCSYLEWDILVTEIAKAVEAGARTFDEVKNAIGIDAMSYPKFEAVYRRTGANWFKRQNPLNVRNPLADRYAMIEKIDNALFVAPTFRK